MRAQVGPVVMTMIFIIIAIGSIISVYLIMEYIYQGIATTELRYDLYKCKAHKDYKNPNCEDCEFYVGSNIGGASGICYKEQKLDFTNKDGSGREAKELKICVVCEELTDVLIYVEEGEDLTTEIECVAKESDNFFVRVWDNLKDGLGIEEFKREGCTTLEFDEPYPSIKTIEGKETHEPDTGEERQTSINRFEATLYFPE